ncbi:MAG: exo-alpha-sialidase [candidate division WOR-3 bacterium]
MEKLRTYTFVCLVLFALGLLRVATAGWDPIQQLTSGPDNASLPTKGRSCATQGNYVHLAYAGKLSATDVVLYMRSTDQGSTWQAPVFLDSATFGNRFGLYADGAGVLHFFNCRKYTTNIYYRRSTNNGETWEPAVVLTSPYQEPAYAADDEARAYVLDVNSSGDRVQLWRTTNSGQNWEGPIVVCQGAKYDAVRVTADHQGRVHAIWRCGTTVGQVWYARSTDNGLSWSTPYQTTSYDSGATTKGVYSDRSQAIVITFSCNREDDYVVSSNGGLSWGTPRALPWPGLGIEDCWADEYNGLHALGLMSSSRVMYFRGNEAASGWGDTVELTGFPSGAVRQNPMVVIDDDHNVHAFWIGRESGTKQVYYRRGLGVGGAAEPISPQPGRGPRLLPNPARTVVFLPGHDPVQLFNHLGQKVAELHPGTNNISSLPNGLFFATSAGSGAATCLVKR